MKVPAENVIKQLKKHWISAWLVCSLAALGAFVVYASYTGVHSIKRVVSTRPSANVMFSSNSLRTTATSQRLSSTVYTITVCNFAQDNIFDVNPDTITYTINAYLAIKVGENNYVNLAEYNGEDKAEYIAKLKMNTENQRVYSIQMISDDQNVDNLGGAIDLVTANNYSATIYANCTLLGGKSSIDQFRIVLDDDELEDTEPDFYIYVEAVPSAPASLTTTVLYNRLCAAKSTADAASWGGSLVEEENCESTDYDFYNYILTGSGTGTVDVMWDPTKFELNDFFFNDLSGNEFVLYDNNGNVTTDTSTGAKTKTFTDGNHTNWEMATIKVDSTKINRYQIQLYKVNGELSYTGDENKASNFIDCNYTKAVNAGA